MKYLHKKNLLPFIVITALLSLGWGSTGHKIISKNIILSLPAEMSFLSFWQDSLAAHASDADYRKSSDPDEGPKHYIDIDNYDMFLSYGYIPQVFDSAVSLYGYNFVMDQGILPWAILASYDTLVKCFERKDWQKAMLTAADLGHYAGDAHMPLHITRNYNGQFTNQYGIHSRFESEMINRYSSQIVYDSSGVDTISDVSDYVFNFIYTNYGYLDSVLDADTYAKGFSGGSYNDIYYQKMWEYSKGFTIELFKSASRILTSMIYKAWIEAGSPGITSISSGPHSAAEFKLFQNYPNPFNPETNISFYLGKRETVKLIIYDMLGKEAAVLINEEKEPGSYNVTFDAANLSSGVYLYKLETASFTQTKKLLLMK